MRGGASARLFSGPFGSDPSLSRQTKDRAHPGARPVRIRPPSLEGHDHEVRIGPLGPAS